MPGRLFLTRDLEEIAETLGTSTSETEAMGLDLAPGQSLLVLDETRELRTMRWGMIMSGRVGARGRPVMDTIVNARSETLLSKSAFEGVRRCLVPADGWYEWTGKPGRKSRWQITAADGGLVVFAGIYDVWQAPGGTEVAQFATITCAPNAEIRPIHDRMGVTLSPDMWKDWIDGRPVPMEPAPDGSFSVTRSTLP